MPQSSWHAWKSAAEHRPRSRPIALLDETFRDGIQSPSVRDPGLEDKRRILESLDRLGVAHVTVGLPAAGPVAREHCRSLARQIVDDRLRIRPCCAARTHIDDIRPIVELSQEVGAPIEVMAFLGSSPIRLYAEDWDLAKLLQLSRSAVEFAVKNGLPCTFVSEDTTRSHPDVLAPLFRNAIDHGATRICLCDTVGHADPDGVRGLLDFVLGVIDSMGLSGQIGVDWHGHNDRGLAVSNTLYALHCGADRAHGTVLGIGERVGNAAIELLLLHLRELGELGPRDVSPLVELLHLTASATGAPLRADHPVLLDARAALDAAAEGEIARTSGPIAPCHSVTDLRSVFAMGEARHAPAADRIVGLPWSC
ncbi:2-isopropylmalate synthase [Sorangium sp. So ce726]|uniref:2-isopropylmalate synthase n=1 Tax=Sorangium sp. So ce726 TaxID=3133319 RepID=UPI003F61ED5A